MLYDPNIEPVFGYRGEFRFLSNFNRLPVPVTEVFKNQYFEYPTTEHAYQAAKSLDPRVRATIASLTTAGQSKNRGRSVACRGDWESVKDAVMLHWVREKFAQYTLQRLLLNTGRRQLIEANTHNDTYWGTDMFGDGENRLGEIHMQVRYEIATDLGVW